MSLFSKIVVMVEMEILETVIRDVVREELQRYSLNEMAMSLKDYKYRIEGILVQIVQNWCLVRYASLSGTHKQLISHWRSELYAHLTNVASLKIKNGNKADVKEKVLYDVINERDFDTDEQSISLVVSGKFFKEKISTNSQYYSETISDFKKNVKNIVNVILSGSEKVIRDYVLSI